MILLHKITLLILSIFLLSSCNNDGCIEADDFGQYEQQTLIVESNSVKDYCFYTNSKSLEDTDQGSGIKECLVTGDIEVISEGGETTTSNEGCLGFTSESDKNICVYSCINSCQENFRSQSGNNEPAWKATSPKEKNRNIGVNIYPGSEVFIKSKGRVTLSENVSEDIEVYGNNYFLSSEFNDKEKIIDTTVGSGLNFSFSKSWKDGNDGSNDGNDCNEDTNQCIIGDANHTDSFLNGIRRSLIYIIPHPSGYDYNHNEEELKLASIGVPLSVDESLWRCSYEEDLVDLYDSDCSSLSYQDNGYPNVIDADAMDIYGITSSEKSDNLGSIGGIIRWDSDMQHVWKKDPFANANCSYNSGCIGEGFTNDLGKLFDIRSGTDYFVNNKNYAVGISIKSLQNTCNLHVKVFNSQGNEIIPDDEDLSPNQKYNSSINVQNEWNQNIIILEKGDKLVLEDSINSQCNNNHVMIVARIAKIHDIEIEKSGLVSFKNLVPLSSNPSCNLYARVINPQGNRLDFCDGTESSNCYSGDFYEYTASEDPTWNVLVNKNNWSRKIYLRKGQKIRFYPKSWENDWYLDNQNQDNNKKRECGVGVAMKIEQRPAFLCRGFQIESVLTKSEDCNLEINEDTNEQKCQKYSKECFDPEGDSFCIGKCQDDFDSPECSALNPNGSMTEDTCASCNEKRDANSQIDPFQDIKLVQCYDLENYYGRVSNIDLNEGLSTEELQNDLISKGAKKLPVFNGYYGNIVTLSDFIITNVDGVIAARSSYNVVPSINGRMKFMLLDGDFKNIESHYANNHGSILLTINKMKEFVNGERLEVKLCKDKRDEDGSLLNTCVSMDPKEIVNSVPKIVEIDDDGAILSHYKFDKEGEIFGFDNESNAVGEHPGYDILGKKYYTHNYNDYDEKTEPLRLVFKIKDIDSKNCVIDGTDSDENNGILVDDECVSTYHNNNGYYEVLIKVKNTNNEVSSIIEKVINPLIAAMDGEGIAEGGYLERAYSSLVQDSRYNAILNICLVVMITFYGIGYLMGVSDFSQKEILARIIKIGVIYMFVGPAGWYWFDKLFVSFFKEGTDYLTFLMASSFDNSDKIQDAIENNNYYDKSVLFSGVDEVLSLIFSDAVMSKISGLLFSSFFGWAYLVIIVYAVIAYVFAVSSAILLYLTAQVFISIVLVLGPFFLIALLFEQTKEMFDKWLQVLIGFSLQQIFLLTTFAFFNILILEVIKLALSYRVCWDNVLTINMGFARFSLFSFWKLPSNEPPSLFSILNIWLIAVVMKQAVSFMADAASNISDGIKSTELSSGIKQSIKHGARVATAPAKQMYNKGKEHIIGGFDKKLFDSGKLASKERMEKRRAIKKDNTLRTGMSKSGDEAVKNYKRNNVMELSRMNSKQQHETLEKVKNDAMVKHAKSRGRTELEANELMNKRGKTISSTQDNLLSKASNRIWNSVRGTNTPIVDKKVSSRFSKGDVKKSIKNVSTEELDELMNKLSSGGVRLGKRGKNYSNEDYNRASDSLIKEGKIRKNFRSKKERDLIEERAKQNNTVDGLVNTSDDIRSLNKNIIKEKLKREGEIKDVPRYFPRLKIKEENKPKIKNEINKTIEQGVMEGFLDKEISDINNTTTDDRKSELRRDYFNKFEENNSAKKRKNIMQKITKEKQYRNVISEKENLQNQLNETDDSEERRLLSKKINKINKKYPDNRNDDENE